MTLPANARPVAFVYTADRSISLPFYTEVLGLRLLGQDPFAATLDAQGLTLRLTTIPDHKPGEHPALCWELPDIHGTVQALAANGVACLMYPGFDQDALGVWSSPDGRTKLAWFPDPEGNVLMLSQKG